MGGLEAFLGGGPAPPLPEDLQYGSMAAPPPGADAGYSDQPVDTGPSSGSEIDAYSDLISRIQEVAQMPSVTEQERQVLMTCQTNIQKLLAQNEKMEEQAGANPVLRKALAPSA